MTKKPALIPFIVIMLLVAAYPLIWRAWEKTFDDCKETSTITVNLANLTFALNAHAQPYLTYRKYNDYDNHYLKRRQDNRLVTCAPKSGIIPRVVSFGTGRHVETMPLQTPAPSLTGIHSFSVASPLEGQIRIRTTPKSRFVRNADYTVTVFDCNDCESDYCKHCEAQTILVDKNIVISNNIDYYLTKNEQWQVAYQAIRKYFDLLVLPK